PTIDIEKSGKKDPKISVYKTVAHPFKRNLLLWCAMLLLATHHYVILCCVSIIIVQIFSQIWTTIQVFFFSGAWLGKYGPLGFVGLEQTIKQFEEMNLNQES